MKTLSPIFVVALATSTAACGDVQQVVTPTAATATRAADVGPASGPPTTVIYSNFGLGMTFDSNPFHGWGINGFLGADIGRQAISQQFSTHPGDYSFVRARVALAHFSGPTRVHVILQKDSLGRPGPAVDDMPVDLLGDPPAIYVATSTLVPMLTDSLYWLTVAAKDNGVMAGWNWNSIGDASSTTFAGTQGGANGPWSIGFFSTRSVFQIEGGAIPRPDGVIHQASGGGTVLWASPVGGFTKVTYGVTALQKSDGSVKGELVFHSHDDQSMDLKGTVTCLAVVGNRAYLTGDLKKALGGLSHFAIGLEDNGEGANASAPDRISSLLVMGDGYPPCYRMPPWRDWTNGNAQVR